MTQRNFQNARNQGDGPKGKSKKSASSAKLKTKAASSVYTPTKEAKAKREKAAAKGRGAAPAGKKGGESAEQVKRRERALVSMMRNLPEYKYWRRIWWILMIIAFAAVLLTWIPNMLVSNGTLPADIQETTGWLSSVGFIFALVALAAAFYIDLRKIRKIQRAQEAKARNLTKSERRELDDAIDAAVERDRQEREERKSKRPWAKKKAADSTDQEKESE